MSGSYETNEWQRNPNRDRKDPLGILGQQIASKYVIESYLGGGGFGEVYLAYNIALEEQQVVIKFFTQVQLQDRFIKEPRILCKLDHQNICRVIDYLPVERALVMNYIPGANLDQKLKADRKPLEADIFLLVMKGVTEGLCFAHEQHIAHRDIKPSNIMIGPKNQVYVIDFGIAKEIKDTATKTGYNILTPQFAAPERHRPDTSYSPFLSDIYEYGVTLFKLATDQHLYHTPENPDFAEWNSPHTRKLSGPLRRALKKATHPDPSLRYQSMSDMADDLRSITRPYRKSHRFRRNITFAAAGLALLIGIAAVEYTTGFLGLWSHPDGQTAAKPALVTGSPADNTQVSTKDPVVAQQAVIPPSPPDTTKKVEVTPAKSADQKPSSSGPITTPVQTESKAAAGREKEPASARPESPPPAPPEPQLAVVVLPAGIKTLLVDGVAVDAYRPHPVKAGRHTIIVEHRDYPVFRTTVDVSGAAVYDTIDLPREFADVPQVNVLLAIKPEEKDRGFDIQFNGQSFSFTKSTVFNFRRVAGEWHIAADIRPVNVTVPESIVVDSCIMMPYVGSATMFSGSDGYLQIDPGGEDRRTRLFIYWSSKRP